MSLPYEFFGQLTDGVPLILPEDGKALPECLNSSLTVQNGTGATVTIEFDYATSQAGNLQDLDTVATNQSYYTPAVKSVKLLATGANSLARFILFNPIGG